MNLKQQDDDDEFLSPDFNLTHNVGQKYAFDDDEIAGQEELIKKGFGDRKISSASSKKLYDDQQYKTNEQPVFKAKSVAPSLICQIHQQEINLMCCVSQWHCEPLCIDCIPEHTKQHNNNKTQPQICKFDQVKLQCLEKCQTYTQQLQIVKQQVQQLINEPYNDSNLINIQLWRLQIVQMVDNYFIQLLNEYQDRINLIKSEEASHYEQLIDSINKQLYETNSNITDIGNNQIKNFGNIFKLNVQKEIDQLQKYVEDNKGKVNEEYKLNNILVKYIQDNIGRMVLIEQQQTAIKQKVTKQPDYTSVKTKSKLCPTCGTTMTYVSDFKKHLECPNCAKVKRPNKK